MRLTWLNNDFICKELYAPYIVAKDGDYLKDLSKRLNLVITQATRAGADEKSIKILNKYRFKILEALKCYYCADIAKCNTIIRNLLRDIGEDPLAVSELQSSQAFPGVVSNELQFFRSRSGNPSNSFSAKDMLHLPRSLRAKSGNYRFSIPGNPSMYLANSSYGCWIETGFPADIDFNVSPVLLEGKQKVFNLAVSTRHFLNLNELDSIKVHTWLKLLMLMIATSYRIKENNRTFKSEYVLSQSIMMGCKKLGYDGVAYYSKRVDNEAFALCAINLALFVDYEKEYAEIVKHIKMDDAFNYSIYKKLLPSLKYKDYELRSVATGFVTNIGSFDRQHPYRETEFCDFDKFLFYTWRDKPNGKGKNQVPWGVPVE
ncbi:MAG: RES domain-containing protein [Lachnospiraceae bacterium]|nr:RES domain-containing protein [Lachnospiraceae bacterium]